MAARARTVGQLADIVQAMRTLANAQRRQAQDQFTGLSRYAEATRAALGQALRLLEASTTGPVAGAGTARTVLVLLSEHGFVGGLNEVLLARAVGLTAGGERLVAVGARGLRLCREKKVAASDGGAMPTTLAAVHSTAQRLIQALFEDVALGRMAEIHVVFAENRSVAGWTPRVMRLLPPDVVAAPSGHPKEAPLHTLPPPVLVARAVEEYAFAQISWAVASAFAAERTARFAAMDEARRHIEDKLAELTTLERELRQQAITTEILEIASGGGSSSAP